MYFFQTLIFNSIYDRLYAFHILIKRNTCNFKFSIYLILLKNYSHIEGGIYIMRIFLLSIFLGICSTCLIRPWFWQNLINKSFFNEGGKRIGFSKSQWKAEVSIEVIIFVVVFMLCILNYTAFEARQNLYGSYLLISLVISYHFIHYFCFTYNIFYFIIFNKLNYISIFKVIT